MNEVIDDLVSQYAEETSFVWSRRALAVHAADHRLADLATLDERLSAHLEGLHASGVTGWRHCEAGLARSEPGDAFSALALALESCDGARMAQVLTWVEHVPQMIPGATSAFGWVAPAALRGTVQAMLCADRPVQREIALTACAMHRVDPGLLSARRFEDPASTVAARALRTAGELGHTEMLQHCLAALDHDDPACRVWAAWSGVLLGDREQALNALSRTGVTPGPLRARAFRLALLAMSLPDARQCLKTLASEGDRLRWLIEGAGLVGDPLYVPWLIGHMRQAKTARLAGLAFTTLTGLGAQADAFSGTPMPDADTGPSDDPDDAGVAMDPDDALPWPDAAQIESWWLTHGQRFSAGTRYFVGLPVTREHCLTILKTGTQPLRVLAAQHLCLLSPATALFNTNAPALRQQRLLNAMR